MNPHPKRAAHRVRLRGFFALGVLACAGRVALAAPADEVKALLDQGRAQQAYELGLKNVDEFGKPDFDFFFGVAAIDAGAPGQGVLALERFLLNNPGSANGRLELGRGYFHLGDLPRARQIFEEVKTMSPPATVLAAVDRYLNAIRERESQYKTALTGYLEGGFGRDSNVNGGISQETITIPVFGLVTLTADGREKSDRYTNLAAGAQITMPISATTSLFAGANADHRGHRSADQFDQRNLGGAIGATVKRAENQFRVSFSASQLNVDSTRYRDLKLVTGEWNRTLDANNLLSMFVQGGNIDYAGDNRIRDARLLSAGANWRHVLSANTKPVLNVGLNVGRENNDRNRDDLARRFMGARAGVGWMLSPQMQASLSSTWQRSQYQGVDPFFNAKRSDRYLSLDAALGYAFTPALGLRFELSRVDNRSNIDLFDFERRVAALKLRYDFK